MYINIPFFTFEDDCLELTIKRKVSSDGMMKASSKYDIDKGNVHYYLPESTIPRFKAKEFADSHKMRNTNKIENATHIVFNEWDPYKTPKSNSTINYEENIRIDASYAKEIIELFHYHGDIAEKDYKKMLALVKSFPFICVTDDHANWIRQHIWSQYQVRWDWQKQFKYFTIFSPSLEDLYNINPSIKFINQKDIQDKISDQAIIITKDKYLELCKLIDTEDEDNVTLAMEIMANSNFKASTVWLFMLLMQRGQTMEMYGNTGHVNFAHMMNHLGYDKSDLSDTDISPNEVESVFKALKRDGHFTKANAEMFLAFFNSSNEYNSMPFYNGDMVNNELRLNENATYDAIDDEDEVQINSIDNL
jgi:hypothetical protein